MLTEYLSTFDDAIDGCWTAPPPPSLRPCRAADSTFMAASLARHCSTSAPLLALCHHQTQPPSCQPAAVILHPTTTPSPASWPRRTWAALRSCGSSSNERGALDAGRRLLGADLAARLRAANHVWLDDIADRAVAAGADRLFHGANGNRPSATATPTR